jgi:hypothetical protein
MKKKKAINDLTNVAPDMAEDWNSPYKKEILLRSYGDTDAERDQNLKEMEDEQREREENGEMKTESKRPLKHLLPFKR